MPPDQISFESERVADYSHLPRPVSFITGLAIRWGFAADERGARRVLVIVLGLALVCTALVFVLGTGHAPRPQVPSINGTYSRAP